jgi:hypothetical protein
MAAPAFPNTIGLSVATRKVLTQQLGSVRRHEPV